MKQKVLHPVLSRIEEIIEYSEAGSLNLFATEKLNYDSSSKLSRFKRENKPPTLEIIMDIMNAFPEIDLNWLLIGKGEMLLTDSEKPKEDNATVEAKENPGILPGFKEIVEAIKDQNDILKAGFNLRDDVSKNQEVQPLPVKIVQAPIPHSGPSIQISVPPKKGGQKGTGR